MAVELETELERARDARGEHLAGLPDSEAVRQRVRLVRQRGWVCFATDIRPSGMDGQASADQSIRGWLNRPGLWRVAAAGTGLVFELPADLIDVLEVDDEDVRDPFAPRRLAQVEDWAVASLAGEIPGGWTAPPEEQARAWATANGWTVERGSVALQGRLVYSSARLAISFPLVTGALPELPPRRLNWLHAVLADAQRRWRMVRIGIDGACCSSGIEAEIDLSGAPADLLEPLFRRSLAVLQCVVRWLAPSIALIVDRDAGAALDGLIPPHPRVPEEDGEFR